MDEITMMSKFPGKCSDCGFKFPEGTLIKFNTFKRTAKHVKCPEPDYSGTEQKNIFEMWVERVQEADKEAEERMSIPPSPYLSQPGQEPLAKAEGLAKRLAQRKFLSRGHIP